ncbi:OVARIAN TUMOR DOMAIN-containing deubiquitinating enzyme 4, partial [Linum perenne]
GAGVLADGRCLFRALAHGDCLRKGKEPPDGDLQRELADELRAQVADELLKRRKEVEGFIEEDLDTYIDRMQKPYVWGGEPELLMASHILKTVISVFMMDRTSEDLKSVASYGEEYAKDGENPINVLFHGYGHYDLLEGLNKRYQKVKA